jgi:predicted DNA-binding protein
MEDRQMSETMQKIQVFLTRAQKAALEALSRRTGQSQSELIRQGIDEVISKAANENVDWRRATESAAGIWAGREGLDDLYADMRQQRAERHQRLFGDDA